MRPRIATWLAWSLGGLSVAMFAAGAVFVLLSVTIAQPSGAWGAIGELLLFAPFLAFPIVGTLIASRRPENSIGWICLVAGLFWMSTVLGEGHDAYELARTGTVTSSATLDALTQWMWVPPVGLLGIYMILLFPDGRLHSRRWRPFAWFAGAVMALISVGFIFVPGPLVDDPGVRNPLGLEWLAWVADVAIFVILLLPLCILASAASLVLRYRRSGGEVREQIKWLAFAASLVGLVYFGSLISELLFAPESLTGNETPPLWVSLQRNLLLLSYAGVPVAVGFAVLKYRLYDIEIIINRALVYGPLTVMLAALYVGSVVVLQATFRTLTGQDTQLTVVVSTLTIAALFHPLRRRVQDFMDRRFYRKKYDAKRTLEAFSVKLRDETDLDSLNSELLSAVRETMQPAYVSLWLRAPMSHERRDLDA
ncbi:MAG: hypothetical protein M3533_00375 [Actinomycetota bacterium]|nr:hypothetical protein [Actinomycetota bacterium]